MPRNGAGVYTLPGSNPVVPLTTIATSWANPTLSDIANELTNSLDRGGRGGMTAAFQLFDGTQALPGLSFITEPGMGRFRSGAGGMHDVIANTKLVTYEATRVSVPGAILFGVGMTPVAASGALQVMTSSSLWSSGTASPAQFSCLAHDFGASAKRTIAQYYGLTTGGNTATNPSMLAANAGGWEGINLSGMTIGVNNAVPIAVATNSLERWRWEGDGRTYGKALHNNAGAVTGVVNQYVASGTLTPVSTNILNIAAKTDRKAVWLRLGNVVHVAGAIDITPTAAGLTVMDIALPPTAGALASAYDLSGAHETPASVDGGTMVGNGGTPGKAQMVFTAGGAVAREHRYVYAYEVL